MCIDKIEQETFNAFLTSVTRFGSTYLLDKTIYIIYICDISVIALFAPVHASVCLNFANIFFLPFYFNHNP